MASKPFKPSRKRLEQARKEGNTLKSPLITQTLLLLFTTGTLYFLAPKAMVRNKILLEYLLVEGVGDPLLALRLAAMLAVEVVVSCLIIGSGAGIMAEIAQIGLRFECVIAAPKGSRLNPAGGIKRVCAGLKSCWQKLLGLCVLCLVFFRFLQQLMYELPGSFGASIHESLDRFGRVFQGAVFLGVAVLGALGALEYLVRRRDFFRDLSMSFDEVRREHRELEGDPSHKSARRAMHEALTNQEIVARVRKAKVIIIER